MKCEHNLHMIKVVGGLEICHCMICGKHKWTKSLNAYLKVTK